MTKPTFTKTAINSIDAILGGPLDKDGKPYKTGPGRPPLAHQFKKGDINNPRGKTKEQRQAEMSNAKKAVKIRSLLLDKLLLLLEGLEPDDLMGALGQMNPNTLKMLKDSEDRGLGAPLQPIAVADPNMRPRRIELAGPSNSDGMTIEHKDDEGDYWDDIP